MAKPAKEEDFQKHADNYAKIAIGNIREMVQALEHAEECDGEVNCGTCDGFAKAGAPCPDCSGSGLAPCTEGKDSDDPEAWHDTERARQRIEEDALSVEVRSDWHTPGDTEQEASEYCILITTGGPAARIVGDLSAGQPTSARFEFQDWFKPWTVAYTDSADDAVMLQYAQVFYFGD